MASVVYISNEEIDFLEADSKKNEIQVMNCGHIKEDRDVVDSNSELDQETLKNLVATLKGRLSKGTKSVDVLVDSANCIIRPMNIPIIPANKISKIVEMELSDFTDKDKEYIYDYSVISEKLPEEGDKGRILCVAIEKKFLEQIVNVFDEAKIKINSIDVDESSQIRLVEHHPLLIGKTFILCSLSGQNFMVSLFVAGKFTYVNEFKLNEQRDNLGIIAELSRIIASFIQFNKAQRTQHEIRNIYFAGMTEMEAGFCHNISNNVGIQTELIPDFPSVSGKTGDYSLAKYLFTTGNIFRNK